MDTAQQPYVRDDTAVRAWQLVREPFTARAWRRVAYALLAVPVGSGRPVAARARAAFPGRGAVRITAGSGRGGSPEAGPGSSPDRRVAGCPAAGSRDARP